MTTDVELDRPAGPTHVTDHVAKGLARLASQFQQPRILGLAGALLRGVQRLEDALWQLYTDRLSTAIGAQLDVLGRVVGETRGGFDDEAFRSLLRATVRANRSSGSGEDLLAVSRLLLGVGSLFTLTEYPRAAVVIEPAAPWPSGDAAMRVLRKTKAGGVALQVVDPPALEPGEGWFTFAADDLLLVTDLDRGFGEALASGDGGRLVGVLV